MGRPFAIKEFHRFLTRKERSKSGFYFDSIKPWRKTAGLSSNPNRSFTRGKKAVGEGVELILDGGIRRGTDIFKLWL